VLVQDPDARPVAPFVHWLAWNIPASVTRLDEGIQAQPRLTEPDGVLQGQGTRGSAGYYGPHPPVGDPAHRYVFQLFALDAVLDVPAGAQVDEVARAMEGHVLAKGKIVGLYQQTIAPLK
jgi:Raf kinase inhibitor-like YbhB/YbcL family protein